MSQLYRSFFKSLCLLLNFPIYLLPFTCWKRVKTSCILKAASTSKMHQFLLSVAMGLLQFEPWFAYMKPCYFCAFSSHVCILIMPGLCWKAITQIWESDMLAGPFHNQLVHLVDTNTQNSELFFLKISIFFLESRLVVGC